MVGWITSSKFRGGQEERFQFKEEDVMGGKAQPLVVGDRVEFYRFVDQTGGSGGEAVSHPRATRVRALDRKPKKSRGERDAERETMKGNSHSGNSGGDSINNRFHIGVVVTLKETYGFLLSFRTGCQFFFHFSEFIGSSRSNSHLPPPELQIGTVVRFILAQNPATGKDIGKSLCLMAGDGKPVFTVQQEADKRLVGKLVKRPSDLALPEDYGDGVIEFKIPSAEDNVQKKEGDANANANANAQKDNNSSNKKVEKNQKVHRAIVSKKQLNESHVHMEENDLVCFDCYRTEKVDLAIAKDVILMRKPNEDFDSSKRELGVISVLKGSFGFITCTERIADVFLHLSQLPEDVSKEDLSVGTDVEFSVNRGAESGRLQAVDIKLAAKGSAVFEEVDEEICQGTVLERLPNKKKASHSSLLVTGLIEGLVKGKLEKLPYMYHDLDTTAASSPSAAATASATSAISSSNNQRGLGDRANNSNKMGRNPRQGDKVTFKVVVELKREKAAKLAGRPGLGRRATAVALIIREGTVVATKGSFGFIEYPKREDEIADTADAAETAGTTEAGDKDKPHAGTTGDDASSQQQTVVVEREADKPKEEEEEGSKKEEAATTDAAEKPPTPQAEEEAAKEEKDGTEQKEETTTTENADQESTDDTPAASAVTDSKKKESNKSRIFFHVSEVFDLVKLHLGDTVEFTICMNSRTQELNATRIKRTKEAVRIAKPPVHKIIEERPDHLKEFSVGSVAKGGSVVSLGRFAKGPDGTKGFSREYQISRGKTFPDPVEEAEAEEEGKKAVKTEEEGEELKSQTSLSLETAPFVPRVEAAPFVPRTAK
jgi:cold shock CspA family protein